MQKMTVMLYETSERHRLIVSLMLACHQRMDFPFHKHYMLLATEREQ